MAFDLEAWGEVVGSPDSCCLVVFAKMPLVWGIFENKLPPMQRQEKQCTQLNGTERVVPSTSIYCTCCCGLMLFYSADFATIPVVACQELIIVILFKATQIASTLFFEKMSGHLESCNKVVQVIHGSMPSILLKLVY